MCKNSSHKAGNHSTKADTVSVSHNAYTKVVQTTQKREVFIALED